MTAVPDIVATVCKTVALRPGDVILTGSPAGLGMTKAKFLAPGNTVAAAADPTAELGATDRARTSRLQPA
jgi:2-keto-4-pentenoate hydratase/2-oxohepta-3-ene-1,7-dioic acid hydratase in catechol pathway